MDKANIFESLQQLNAMTTHNRVRLEMVLSHIHGPRPSEANEKPQHPIGMLATVEAIARTAHATEMAITQLENILGSHPNVGGLGGQAQNASQPVRPSY